MMMPAHLKWFRLLMLKYEILMMMLSFHLEITKVGVYILSISVFDPRGSYKKKEIAHKLQLDQRSQDGEPFLIYMYVI